MCAGARRDVKKARELTCACSRAPAPCSSSKPDPGQWALAEMALIEYGCGGRCHRSPENSIGAREALHEAGIALPGRACWRPRLMKKIALAGVERCLPAAAPVSSTARSRLQVGGHAA